MWTTLRWVRQTAALCLLALILHSLPRHITADNGEYLASHPYCLSTMPESLYP